MQNSACGGPVGGEFLTCTSKSADPGGPARPAPPPQAPLL